LCFYDNLRCDKSLSSGSLEVRVPFLDKDFLQFYMSIDPTLKMPKTFGIEKYLLRKAFDSEDLLPKKVLWRVKEAFSDGCSSKKDPWYSIL
jgi:asparagine synthase (glutamine-hydrolysing)